MLINKIAEHDSELDMARQRVLHDINIPIFAELIGKVTPFALRKILIQYQHLSTLPLPKCTNMFTQSMGLPYAHTILDHCFQKEDIHLSDVHLHWHFDHPDTNTVSSVQFRPLLVHEPAIIKPKECLPESKNKQKAASSTT